MDTLGEKLRLVRGLKPQAVNDSTVVKGDEVDRRGFDSAVVAFNIGAYTPSGTTAISVAVKIQESVDVSDGNFADVAGDTVTVSRTAKQMTITFDADLSSSDVIDLNLDGVAISPVTYSSSHATTMGLIATEMNSAFTHITTTQSGRTLTMLADVADDDFTISDVAVVGGGEAGSTIATTVEKAGSSEGEIDVDLRGLKQYIRVHATTTITTGGTALLQSAAIALGNPKIKPVAQL